MKKKKLYANDPSEDCKCFNTHNSECIYPLLRLQLYERLRIQLAEGREIFHFSPNRNAHVLGRFIPI